MKIEDFQNYFVLLLLIGFFAYKYWKTNKIKKSLPALLQSGAIVIDVRTPSEYAQASNALSINMPLAELSNRISKLDKNKTIVLCCASGARSAMAVGIFKSNGFKNVINAGAWSNTI